MAYRDLVVDFTSTMDTCKLIEALDVVFANGIIAYHANKTDYRLYVTLNKYAEVWGQMDADNNMILTVHNSTIVAKTYPRELAPVFTFKN
jgi:hypothetical protein